MLDLGAQRGDLKQTPLERADHGDGLPGDQGRAIKLLDQLGCIASQRKIAKPHQIALGRIGAEQVDHLVRQVARAIGRGVEEDGEFGELLRDDRLIIAARRRQPGGDIALNPEAFAASGTDHHLVGVNALGNVGDQRGRAAMPLGEFKQARGLAQRASNGDHRAFDRGAIEHTRDPVGDFFACGLDPDGTRPAEQGHRARFIGQRGGISLDRGGGNGKFLRPQRADKPRREMARPSLIGAVEQVETNRRIGLFNCSSRLRWSDFHRGCFIAVGRCG